MFAFYVFAAMVVSAFISAAMFFAAPRGESTWLSECGAFAGLAAVFFAAVLAIEGAHWVIQGVAAVLGF